jgi:hypothetical protein
LKSAQLFIAASLVKELGYFNSHVFCSQESIHDTSFSRGKSQNFFQADNHYSTIAWAQRNPHLPVTLVIPDVPVIAFPAFSPRPDRGEARQSHSTRSLILTYS